MIYLSEKLEFPSVTLADEDGFLAIGGDLSPERLILAYQNGIFPWYNENDPILWWSPPLRMVLFPDELYVSKSMKKLFREEAFSVTYNTCFEQVIRNCAVTERVGQEGTWINNDIIEAYCLLHKQGKAHSVEVWHEGALVGGFYGIRMGKVFCGESMFSHKSNASKYGFIHFVKNTTDIELIDCQVYSSHLESLGAREIPREEFLKILKNNKF